jgi:hypothetical protein
LFQGLCSFSPGKNSPESKFTKSSQQLSQQGKEKADALKSLSADCIIKTQEEKTVG